MMELSSHGSHLLLFQDDRTGRKRVNASALRFVLGIVQDETGKTIRSAAAELVDGNEKVGGWVRGFHGYGAISFFSCVRVRNHAFALSNFLLFVAGVAFPRRTAGEFRFGLDLTFKLLLRRFGGK